MGSLRRPLLVIALIILSVVVLVELGALGIVSGSQVEIGTISEVLPEGDIQEALNNLDDAQRNELNRLAETDQPPGLAITFLALVDGILLFVLALIGASLIIPERVHGRIQGIITLIFSIVIIIVAIAGALLALAAVILMIALLLAFPFGTLAYLAKFGFFNRDGAAAILAFIMLLKICFAVVLFLAHQRFVQNIGLVLLIITSFVASIIVGFLHGFVPGFLVSITDSVAAIILAIIAIIWAIVFLIGSIISIVTSVRARV